MTRKKSKKTRKKSITGYARGGLYVLALSTEAVRAVAYYGMEQDNWAMVVEQIAKRYTGRDVQGNFNITSLVEAYGPVVAFAIIDAALSKLGVYKKMARLL